MSTVSQICEALRVRLSTLPGVDQSTIDEYLPPVKTEMIALVIPPLDQKSQTWWVSARRTPLFQSYKIRCEFWIKLDTANLSLTLQRAREIGRLAIRALIAEPTLSGAVQLVGVYGRDAKPLIETEVADRPITIAGVPYMVATIVVPVTDYADPD